jgi:hypothetical protein
MCSDQHERIPEHLVHTTTSRTPSTHESIFLWLKLGFTPTKPWQKQSNIPRAVSPSTHQPEQPAPSVRQQHIKYESCNSSVTLLIDVINFCSDLPSRCSIVGPQIDPHTHCLAYYQLPSLDRELRHCALLWGLLSHSNMPLPLKDLYAKRSCHRSLPTLFTLLFLLSYLLQLVSTPHVRPAIRLLRYSYPRSIFA